MTSWMAEIVDLDRARDDRALEQQIADRNTDFAPSGADRPVAPPHTAPAGTSPSSAGGPIFHYDLTASEVDLIAAALLTGTDVLRLSGLPGETALMELRDRLLGGTR